MFARGQIASGAATLTGSVAGGVIAEQVGLGVPFVLRGIVLLVMFVVAFRLMRDLGFTPDRSGGVVSEARRIAGDSIDYGWRVTAVKWLMVESLLTGGVGIYAFYALQPYLLELWAIRRRIRSPGSSPRSPPAPRSSAGSWRLGSGDCSIAGPRG